MHVKKAIIPAAGLGTRFLPATKAIPKEMIPIIDKPMIQYIVEECVAAGIEQIILITARGKDSILDHFDYAYELDDTLRKKGKTELLNLSLESSNLAKITAVRQMQPLGLGHAVSVARDVIGNEPFAVLLGDDLIVSKEPCIGQLIRVFEKTQKSVIAVMDVPRTDVSKYGIIDGKKTGDREYLVKDMVEKPSVDKAPSTLACPGRYVLTPDVLILDKVKPGNGGEIQLTDALSMLAKESGLYAYLFEGQRYDTGDKLGYIHATLTFALQRPDLREGVRSLILDAAQKLNGAKK